MIEDLPANELSSIEKVVTIHYSKLDTLMNRENAMKNTLVNAMTRTGDYKFKDSFIAQDEAGYTLNFILTPVI